MTTDPNAPLLPEQIRRLLQKQLNPVERFTDLFSGKDDRADMQILLLYNILTALVGQPPGPDGETFPTQMGVQIPLKVVSTDIMRNIAALTTDEISPTRMADCRKALRALVWINNTFDQQVSVTIIGNTSNDHSGSYDLHTMNVSANSKGAYGLKNEEWMPWIAAKVTPAVNPTTGTISAVVVVMAQGNQ